MVLSLNVPEINLFNRLTIKKKFIAEKKIYTYNNKNFKNENKLLLFECKKKINNFQIIIINNLAFFSVYNKGYFNGQKDHSKNIFHCMKPSNTWMEYSFRNANKLLLLLKINKINKIIKIAMSASIYTNDKKKQK